jgi:hypothetical protein
MKKRIVMFLLAVFSFGTIVPAFAIPVQTHLKKDGTPDRRYKENKHLTKAGKPDMRYKSNNPNAGKHKKK